MINTWTQWNSKIAHEQFQSFLKKKQLLLVERKPFFQLLF